MKASAVSTSDLIAAKVLRPHEKLVWRRRTEDEVATVMPDGTIKTRLGLFSTPSGAATQLNGGTPRDGWIVWRVASSGATLAELRRSYEMDSD